MADHRPDNRAEMPCVPSLEALRRALNQHARDGAVDPPEESWRTAARLMCEDARARAVQVEDLLIALKRSWPAVADGEGVSRLESPRLLARFVTICVQEYYSPLG